MQQLPYPPNRAYEQTLIDAGLSPVAGVDEAGRGACAGPLVAAAVILSDEPACLIDGLDDSKALSAHRRDALYDQIMSKAQAVACVEIPAARCDCMGIQKANLAALRQAVWELSIRPQFVITDGFSVPGIAEANIGMWKADKVALCVSAASIIAKVTRDRIMDCLDVTYPDYGFHLHKGYATKHHQEVLEKVGPCPEHRLSYANVARTIRVESP